MPDKCERCDRTEATDEQNAAVLRSVRDSCIGEADPSAFVAGVCYGDLWLRHLGDCTAHLVDWRARVKAAEGELAQYPQAHTETCRCGICATLRILRGGEA